jgi:hypothetical protein
MLFAVPVSTSIPDLLSMYVEIPRAHGFPTTYGAKAGGVLLNLPLVLTTGDRRFVVHCLFINRDLTIG